MPRAEYTGAMKPSTFALPLLVLAGCALSNGERANPHPELEPYLGTYRGGFDSARTPTPDDDLNHNPCPEPGDQP